MEPSLDDFIEVIEREIKMYDPDFDYIEILASISDADIQDFKAKDLEWHAGKDYLERDNLMEALRKRIDAGVTYEDFENFFNAALSYEKAAKSVARLRWDNVAVPLLERTIAIYDQGLAEPPKPVDILWLYSKLAVAHYYQGNTQMADKMIQMCRERSDSLGIPLVNVSLYEKVVNLLAPRPTHSNIPVSRIKV